MRRKLKIGVASALAGGLLLSTLVGTAAVADQPPSIIYSETASSTSAPVYSHGIVLRNQPSGGANGTALVTYERNIFANPAVFKIHRSTNNGASWTQISTVTDTQYNRGLRGQPDLYELPQAVGNLPKGTILLAGSVQPLDQSSTTLVLYKSTNAGVNWSYMSTIDVGGPAIYDPSPSSTTTTIWEPEIYLDSSNRIVVAYSDERLKSQGVLQAIVHRTSSNAGISWGPVVTDIAIPDQNTRPGMMTVTKLPDGRYFGAYEMVGLPNVPVYGRYSSDGQNWGTDSALGTKLATPSGNFLFGSPQVVWINTGGNGTLVVNGQRYITSSGETKSMFLTNTNLGAGSWTPVPQPVQITGDIVSQAGFSQSTAASLDNKTLIQFTTVNNSVGQHDVVSGTMPLNSRRYAASTAVLTNAQPVPRSASVTGSDVGFINTPTSAVTFNNVSVPTSGTYQLRVRYSNESGAASAHAVTVNGGAAGTVAYPRTANWNSFLFATRTVTLNAGTNTIRLSYNGTFAEIDQIEIYQ